MPKRLRKMLRDINQLGKAIVDLTTGESEPEEIPPKNPHAVALGLSGIYLYNTQRKR